MKPLTANRNPPLSPRKQGEGQAKGSELRSAVREPLTAFLPVEPLDRKMEQVFHDFIVNLYVFFCLIF